MKINFKKTFLISAVVSLLATGAYAEDMITYLNDGHITFEGSSAKNESVTIVVTKKDYDFSDEQMLKNENSDEVAYWSDTTSDSNGKYSFKFKLSNSGLYNVYIGSNSTSESYKIEYTNKTGNETAIGDLNEKAKNQTAADVAQYIQDNKDELRVHIDEFALANTQNVGAIVYDYLKDNGEQNDSDAVKNIIEKAVLIDCINNKKLSNIYELKEIMGLDEKADGYFIEGNSSEIQQELEKTPIADIEAFDESLLDAIILVGINNSDGTGTISSILTDYCGEFGITTGQVTTDLCSAIADNGDFDSVDSIKTFISTYTPPTNNPGYSSPGGGGNGGGSYVPGIPSGYIETSPNKTEEAKLVFFKDVDAGHWASEAIGTLYTKNIISGKSDDMFYPQDTVKREEFVKMLVTAVDFDIVNEEIPFEDVTEDDWYYEYVRSAYLGYIVKGVSETKFGAGTNITRQDLSVMIVNAVNASSVTLPQLKEGVTFTDEDTIADYAKESIHILQRAGVISGYEDGRFNPRGNATRAEAAQMIYKILQYIE